ncbi:MAG: CopD family protein, partial [Pseudomonadota bacterium]
IFAKLALVAVLVAHHVWCGKLMIDLRRNRNRHGHVWYRWFNEFPVVILIAVVLLAVLKPG